MRRLIFVFGLLAAAPAAAQDFGVVGGGYGDLGRTDVQVGWNGDLGRMDFQVGRDGFAAPRFAIQPGGYAGGFQVFSPSQEGFRSPADPYSARIQNDGSPVAAHRMETMIPPSPIYIPPSGDFMSCLQGAENGEAQEACWRLHKDRLVQNAQQAAPFQHSWSADFGR